MGKSSQLLRLIGVVSIGLAWLAPLAHANTDRNVSHYNLENGVGLKGNQFKAEYGYDPVSVFPEGGGTSLPGVASIRSDFQGVTYYFASEENKTKFLANPDKYEPTYGGWCAYAMASGQKIPIDTRYVTIHGNRAHYFVSARAKANFDRDVASYENRADQNWKGISGENPRL